MRYYNSCFRQWDTQSFATVFSHQIIDGLLVFIHLHDGRSFPPRLWKRIG